MRHFHTINSDLGLKRRKRRNLICSFRKMEEVDDFINLAGIALSVKRYDDAKDYIYEYTKAGSRLNDDERTIFAQTWSCIIKEKMDWRKTLLTKLAEDSSVKDTIEKCISDLDTYLISLVDEGLNIIENQQQFTDISQQEIFHYKILQTNFKYVLSKLPGNSVSIDTIKNLFDEAYQMGIDNFEPGNNLSLQLSLDYSQFLIEQNEKDKAKTVLKKASESSCDDDNAYVLDSSFQNSSLIEQINYLLCQLE